MATNTTGRKAAKTAAQADPRKAAAKPARPAAAAPAADAKKEDPAPATFSAVPAGQAPMKADPSVVADIAKKAGEELVFCTVPKSFMFTMPDGRMIQYRVGECKMPRSHAEDSFSRGMGVTIDD